MAVNPKSVVSWGLIGVTDTQVIEGPITLTVAADALLEIVLEADEITVEIDDD